jgi:hypothetical protein
MSVSPDRHYFTNTVDDTIFTSVIFLNWLPRTQEIKFYIRQYENNNLKYFSKKLSRVKLFRLILIIHFHLLGVEDVCKSKLTSKEV